MPYFVMAAGIEVGKMEKRSDRLGMVRHDIKNSASVIENSLVLLENVVITKGSKDDKKVLAILRRHIRKIGELSDEIQMERKRGLFRNAAAYPAKGKKSGLDQRRIMVVDDNKDYAFTLKKFFEERGYDVVCANSARECISKLDNCEPKLVLLDIMMPGPVTARDVVDTLRNKKNRRRSKVIYLSAVGIGEKQRRELIKSGFVDDFIKKPVGLGELLRLVEFHLEK